MGFCQFCFLLAFCCIFFEINVSHGYLGDILKEYDTLHLDSISHRVTKRDLSGLEEKIVSFSTLGRKFELHLSHNKRIFAENFEAYTLDNHGISKEVKVNKRNFFKGFVEGEPESDVSANFYHGIMTARIETKEDVYVIEPSMPHLRENKTFHMIAYRRSDVLFNFTNGEKPHGKKAYSFCGYNPAEKKVLYADEKVPLGHQSEHRRTKRAVPTRIICQLALRADYSFYKEMGSNEEQTINYIVGVIDRVDRIYKSTVWSKENQGYGFEIKEIKVETKLRRGCQDHYNCDPGNGKAWDIKKLLEVFSYDPDWSHVCLAHLFTYQDFSNGVIGLAYVGNPKRNAVGGICTETYYRGGRNLYLNTGLSSSMNWNRRLLTEEADIVTAHEIGHNFGSEHDPNTDECAPGGDGGMYIMYPASVSGRKSNNERFSPCSKRAIDAVLRTKSPICFKEPSGEICGNWKVEGNEECDPGNLATRDSKCCTKTCKLKPGAQCSDGYGSPCCKNCTYVTKGTVCREANNMTCEGHARCNGMDKTCPPSGNLLDGTPCVEMGKCSNGKCQDYCQAHHNMTSCICTDLADACKFCCKRSEGDTCKPQPLGNKQLFRQDGQQCGRGICDNHVCKKVSQDAIEKFWSWVTDLTVDKFGEFMKANIVGAIMFFAAILWIPVSCFVNMRDKKRDKEEAREAEWRNPKNTELFRPPKVTKSGDFVYRQESVPSSSRAKRPVFKPNRSGARYGRR